MLKALRTSSASLLRMPGLPGKKKSGKARATGGKAGKSKRVRTRSSVKGATRKTVVSKQGRPSPSVWFNRLLILAGAVVVIGAAVEAYITLQGIPVQRISVTGELAHTRYEEVQQMVQPALAGGFLSADLQRIREQLQALPWIYEATVRRKWPNALEINVMEQLPIARWGSDGFLNHEGQVFRSDRGEQWQSLPLLRGPDGSAHALVANYQRLVDLLRPLGLSVERLAVDERGQLEASLAGGVQLVLGSGAFVERMQRFVTIYNTELASTFDDVTRVDLRYTSGAAVAFRPVERVAGLSGK